MSFDPIDLNRYILSFGSGAPAGRPVCVTHPASAAQEISPYIVLRTRPYTLLPKEGRACGGKAARLSMQRVACKGISATARRLVSRSNQGGYLRRLFVSVGSFTANHILRRSF
jgi:hypothetical protein